MESWTNESFFNVKKLGGRAARSLHEWSERALDLAFPWPESVEEAPEPITPPFCRQCGLPYPALEGKEMFTCTSCSDQSWHFEWARAGFWTQGQVHEAIIGFKYGEQFFRRKQLVGWLAEAYRQHAGKMAWDGLVPVPLYHLRRRERGFNQARELADGLGAGCGVAVWDCLARLRETPSQTGLGRQERRDNMKGAFRVKGRFDVRGRNLLIIDDVFTTGATTNACARALMEAGAGRLAVLTIARS